MMVDLEFYGKTWIGGNTLSNKDLFASIDCLKDECWLMVEWDNLYHLCGQK